MTPPTDRDTSPASARPAQQASSGSAGNRRRWTRKGPFRWFWSEERNLTILLGIVIFDFFILSSVTSALGENLLIRLLNSLTLSLLLLTGVLALTRHRIIQILFGVIVSIIIAVRWGRLLFSADWLIGWDLFLSFVSFIAFTVVVLGHVFKEGPMTRYRIEGAVAAYLLLAMAYALAYFLTEFELPGSFLVPAGEMKLTERSWRLFYYFSISTLTTLGYGDVTPALPIARNLVMSEALIGQLYPAILLARLVSLHTETHKSKGKE